MAGVLINGDAADLPIGPNSIHCVMTSPPYWGMREYHGDQTRGRFPNLGFEPSLPEHLSRMVELGRQIRRVLRPDGVWYLNYGDGYATQRNGRPAVDVMEIDGRTFRDKPFSTNIALPDGNLLLLPHRVAIAIQEDGWILRNDLPWFKRNAFPETIMGRRFQRPACGCVTERREALIKAARDRGIRSRPKIYGEGFDKPGDVAPDPDCPHCHGTGRAGDHTLYRGSFRHSRCHEYVFVFTPEMHYWGDQEVVRKPYAAKTLTVTTVPNKGTGTESRGERFAAWYGARRLNPGGANPKSVIIEEGEEVTFLDWLADRFEIDLPAEAQAFTDASSNPESVLDIATRPYHGRHFATYVTDLIEPLILAACPRWCCPICGTGWSPVIERPDMGERPLRGTSKMLQSEKKRQNWGRRPQSAGRAWQKWRQENPDVVTGYRPSCEHPHSLEETVPGIVLDPFIGSGTTGLAAENLGMRWIGLDMSMEYLDHHAKPRAQRRMSSVALKDLPLFDLEADSDPQTPAED